MLHANRFRRWACWTASAALLLTTAAAHAADLEAFEFNDSSGTLLAGAANSVNAANLWVEDADMSPSDIRGGSYNIVKPSSAVDTNFLQIDNVTSGSVWYTARMSEWNFVNFDAANPEQFRISFLNDDDMDFGATITAEARIERDAVTGDIVVSGLALGSGATSLPVSDVVSTTQAGPFTLSLKLDKDSDTYSVYYKDGSNATRVLGRGLADPGRDANSIRMVANNNFGDGSFDYPFFTDEVFSIDRIAVSNTSPFNDLLTLEVDRTTGAMTLRNTSGAPVTGWEGYSITSGGGSLNPAGWDPVGASVTTSTRSELSETFAAQSLASGGTVALSTPAGAWLETPYEDLAMELTLTGGATRSVDVKFVGGAGRYVAGDLNTDGVIDVADYLLLAANAETSLAGLTAAEQVILGDLDGDGVNSILDFVQFKSAYEAANGGGSFARMLASVPEPTSLGLVAASALVALTRRRRRPASPLAGPTPMRSLTLASLLMALALASAPTPATAAIFEDFLFNDSLGTTLDGAANAANPSNAWVVDPDIVDMATTGTGVLRARNSTGNLESNYLDIDNITTGKAWLVVEFAGWSFNTDTANPANFDPAAPEEVRFAFLDNDNDPPSGSTLSGQFLLQRTATGDMQLIGNTAGSGGTNITGSYDLAATRSTPFTVALEVDVTDTEQTYSVYYRDDAAPFAQLGTGSIAPGRDANSLRFALRRNISGDGEFVDINRVYLTDVSPLGEVAPTTLSLEVNTLTGAVSIINPTDGPIRFDSYRIASDAGQLDSTKWVSLADQDADTIGGGDEPGESWVEAGGAGSNALAESFLLADSELVAGELVALGPVFGRGVQDLTFQYHDVDTGSVVTVTPTYVTTPVYGDYNNDGVVNAADYTVWRDQGAQADGNLDGSVNSPDYYVWSANYGSVVGTSTAIPEPSALAVLTVAGVIAGLGASRRV